MWQFGIIEDRLGKERDQRLLLAREIGFDCVELSFGTRDVEDQPLWSEAGAMHVRSQAQEAGIVLSSVCATYFNEHGLGDPDRAGRKQHVDVLRRLMEHAALAGAKVILLPFFGRGAMNTVDRQQWAVESVATCARRASELGIRLAFEATLPSVVLRDMAMRVMNLSVGVYYDVGNVRPEGFDVRSDLRELSSVLYGVHVKDRTATGANVALGSGDVDFAGVRDGLAAARYRGPLVLETPTDGDAWTVERANLGFLRRALEP